MKKFDYQWFRLPDYDKQSEKNMKTLNALGNRGWKLHGEFITGHNGIKALFIREVRA